MNYGGCVKSTDGGNTWERVYDLTWVNHATGNNSQYGKLNKVKPANSPEELQEIINKDNALNENGGNINIVDHEGYFFTQIFPVDGKDGYIYIFGEGGYRTHGIKLGRVKVENFEDFESYEYFGGYDQEGAPIWYEGVDGLQTIAYDDDAFLIGDTESQYGEHSVAYNPYLQKWILTYLRNGGGGLMYRLAENVYGPYGEEKQLMGYGWDQLTSWEDKRITSIYGGFIHEKWMEENGKVMYCTYSQFFPIYNSSIMKVTFE